VPITGYARRLGAGRPAAAAVATLERLLPGRPDVLAVLTIHRVAPDDGAVTPGLLSATPEGLAALLDILVRRYAVIDLEGVLRRAAGGAALPRRSVLLTIDDAYADVATHTWPAMRARGLPAVLFVPTAYPDASDRTFWWDRLYGAIRTTRETIVDGPAGPLALSDATDRDRAYRALREPLKGLDHDAMIEAVDKLVRHLGGAPPTPAVASWASLRAMRAEGLTLAPHTRTHPLLSRLPPARLPDEVEGARTDLERATGATTPAFAYPSGATSPEAVVTVRRAGFQAAFTTARGVNDLRTADWAMLHRVNVSVRTPGPLVRAQIMR
jgi:peptidoglycan/xylan/chitin deacetylase (PgdA/CDA1 family)